MRKFKEKCVLWILEKLRNFTLVVHKVVAPKGDFIFFSIMNGHRYLDVVCQSRNSATAHVVILIQDFLKWKDLSIFERNVAREFIIENLEKAAQKEQKDVETIMGIPEDFNFLCSHTTQVFLHGNQVPLVQSLDIFFDTNSTLVTGKLKFFNALHYRHEIQHFGKAKVHEASVYIKGFRRNKDITCVDIALDSSMTEKQYAGAFDYLKRVSSGEKLL